MTKKEMLEQMSGLEQFCNGICDRFWNNPEIGGTEKESADHLRKVLSDEGFVIVNEEKLPHAFYAEYGNGKPVVAILGEYDALPGLSQKVSTVKEPVEAGQPGHGCGHNLLGAASVTGAIAVKRFLEAEGISGTVRFYGCPEEELLSGKVKMAYYHMFDDCDLALSWHPGATNMVYDEGYLASASVKFNFTGRTSHAAFAPEHGRSALDAVELMNIGANYLREHVVDKARIHYTTDSGGYAPNIVPGKASAWYYTRAPHMADVKDILRRLELVARGAAMMTETEVTVDIEYGCCDMKGEKLFEDITLENMKEVALPVYTEEEMAYAKAIQDSVSPDIVAREQKAYAAQGKVMADVVEPRERWEKIPMTASSDSGDVSQMMPMNLFTATCWPYGVSPHTWQSSSAAGSTIGQKGAFYAGKVIAAVAYDLFTKPELAKNIKEEFDSQDRDEYEPMYFG